MRSSPCRFVRACFVALTAALVPCTVCAQTVFLSGVVVDAQGRPVAGATVRVSGQSITLSNTTDAGGRFAFPTLNVGRYRLSAVRGEAHAEQTIDLASAGLDLRVVLLPLKTIGQVVAARTSPVVRQSGTDVSISSSQLERLPTGASLPTILTQMPSAATASNGQVHVNGDHNGLNYYIDGVQVPANLNRVLGTEIDPSFIGYLDLLEGAYPAQYGDKFAAILNVGTKAAAGPAGAGASLTGGSYNTYEAEFNVHAPVGSHGGSLTVASYLGRNGWGLDPPVADPVHNDSSDANEFLRLNLPVNGTDTLNLDAIHSVATFQIPPDTGNGVPPGTDDNEYQSDSFVALQYRHAIGGHGSLQFGPSLKVSNILDTNDLLNDFSAGGAPPPPGQINCIDFTDCVFSVYANRTARDYRFNLDYALKSPHHEVRAGALYDASSVLKAYNIFLQPYSALDRTGIYAANDEAPNMAHQQEAYVQDSWTMGGDYELDYGLRMDAFQIFSTNFDSGFSQWSPRVKFARSFGPRSSVYVYYGRLFVPFSFENVNPATAAALYYAPPPQTFDLQPQRDSLYEAGGHAPLGQADLGVRIMHKVSSNWIDDTQVGATNLHQDINFPVGRVDAQSLYVQAKLPRDGRVYGSVTHSLAVNSLICETNLLQDCTLGGYYTTPGGGLTPYYLSPGGGLAQADHDQHWDANAGWLFNDLHGGWFSINGEYGSGLSMGDPNVVVPGPPAYTYAYDVACAGGDAVNCKVPPHLVFNVEKGVAIGSGVTAALSVLNLLNDRYAITLDNSLQGTHYARPRTILLQLSARR
jgi:Carboxypeptidase regulatory-like domain/TonB dependent receptor-like, beta-barrel